MLTIDRFPRCRAYLKAMYVRFDDPQLTDYWCAVILADAFSDGELVAAGVDYGRRNGAAILGGLEALFGARKAKRVSHDDLESLKAFLGSRWVKVSKLPDDAAYWRAATILWPEKIKSGSTGSLGDLVALIRSMPKKARQAARANLCNVPLEWRA